MDSRITFTVDAINYLYLPQVFKQRINYTEKVSKEHLHYTMISVLREIEHLKKTPLVISKVVYTLMNDELLTYIIHTSALVYDDSQNLRAEFSQNARTHHETALFSDDSSERL